MTNHNITILIVEDDADIAELMQLLLEREGYSVRVASDGLEALQQLRTEIEPDLILLDLMMPRMDGEQFLKHMRADHHAHVPVVILSGHVSAQAKARELHAACCLMKPVESNDLLQTVKQFALAHSHKDAF
jgi:chemosensory pili system protein ChpA (sensor histidine kinase/response regulator)